MRVAAYQAPLLHPGSFDALALIRRRVEQCEAENVAILCCPEAVLGGLADHSDDPIQFAVATGRIGSVLAPLASDTVTTIVGFTELADDGRLYNSAAVWHRGAVAGVYRKHHPAIKRSVYAAGGDTPVFRVNGLTFGIVICYDSTFAEPAARMAAEGASVLFVPTNNGLPHSRAPEDIVAQAREADVARATDNNAWIVRADVAGRTSALLSAGSSGIVRPDGSVLRAAPAGVEDMLVADLRQPFA
ncbi:MAG: carbon-nitrogen hydrolase family protein [Luteitalea sp.]|nr:carbon-nitrogen hydrolase family protein [Luteitalea sp.]